MSLDVLNYIIVTLDGNIITLLLTPKKKTAPQLAGLAGVFVFSGLLNLLLWKVLDVGVLYMLYPLTVHMPLLLYYIFAVRTPVYKAVFAITAAYMLTTPRKWLCVLILFWIGGGVARTVLTEVLVSAVLIILTAKFLAPVVMRIFEADNRETNLFCLLPAAVYTITYATTVYSDFLYSYPMITIPVLTTALSVFFISFVIYFFDYTNTKTNSRHSRELVELQLRSVEKLAEHTNIAETYFCGNKTINAFLSVYKANADANGILFRCDCNLTDGLQNVFEVLVIVSAILDDALGKAKKYVRFEAVQKNKQVCIMAETDGASDYDKTMLAILKSVADKYRGVLYTYEDSYKIQMSINN